MKNKQNIQTDQLVKSTHLLVEVNKCLHFLFT